MNLDTEKVIAEQTKIANEKLIEVMKNDMRTLNLPYEKLYEQNAMVGEDMRSRAMVNYHKIFELQSKIGVEEHVIKEKDRQIMQHKRQIDRI